MAEQKVKRDTPNRGTADPGLLARLPDDAFKVQRYFPTLVFTLEVPDSGNLNAHLTDEIYAERERDRTGVSKSNFPELGSWHSHVKLHKDAAFRGLVEYVSRTRGARCSERSKRRVRQEKQ